MNLYTVGRKYPEFVRPGATDVQMDFDKQNLITFTLFDPEPNEAGIGAFQNRQGFRFGLRYEREQILLVFKAPTFPYLMTVYHPYEAAALSREEFMAYPAEGDLGINLLYVNSNTGELLAKRFLTGSQWCHEELVAAVKDKLSLPYDPERDREIFAEVCRELPDPRSIFCSHRSVRCVMKRQEEHRHNPRKRIWINSLEKVEEYLGVDPQEDEGLHSLRLSENGDVRGVKDLLALIPLLPDQDSLQVFYEKTGLNIRVERYEGCDFKLLDRNGSYPREFLNVWSPDFQQYAQETDQHPEWFEPQEGADLLIRYVERTREIDPRIMEILSRAQAEAAASAGGV